MRAYFWPTVGFVSGAFAHAVGGWRWVALSIVLTTVLSHLLWPRYAAWLRRRGYRVTP